MNSIIIYESQFFCKVLGESLVYSWEPDRSSPKKFVMLLEISIFLPQLRIVPSGFRAPFLGISNIFPLLGCKDLIF